MNASFDLSRSRPSVALESRSLMEPSTEPEMLLRRLDIQAFASIPSEGDLFDEGDSAFSTCSYSFAYRKRRS